MHQLVLASESPRRKQLLLEAGYFFETFLVKVSEHLEKNLSVDAQIHDIAGKKAEAAFAAYKPLKQQDYLLLSADTMVCLEGQNLGKPQTKVQACQFLRQLSGRAHQVKTAICLIEGRCQGAIFSRGKTLFSLATTTVNFRNLSDSEIENYVSSGAAMDKAGGYGIQDKGANFVSSIDGPYDNVVGLPRDLLATLLGENNLQVEKSIISVAQQIQAHDLRQCGAQIVAVSKLHSSEKVRDLYQKGQHIFAENYVQEAILKIENLKDLAHIRWHFIGHLQKNKVKSVVGLFDIIHSVDSVLLAEMIDRIAQQKGLKQKILIQVNLGNEASKSGFSAENLTSEVVKLKDLKNICVVGWMAMPPPFSIPEQARPFFCQLRNLRDQFLPLLPEATALSMGTSSDYIIAVEEGATLVRLGTIIFGERPRKQP